MTQTLNVSELAPEPVYQAPERRARVLQQIDIAHRTGIEFGPRENPFVHKFEGPISYLDFVSGALLRERLAASNSLPPEDIARVVDTDFVLENGKTLRDLVGPTRHFDYAIVCHVIEHIPNPIQWFREVGNILNPEGIISLVIPDKRYLLDYYRPNTTLGEIVQAYLEGATRPSLKNVFDSIELSVDVEAADAWETPNLGPSSAKFTNLLENAYKHAKSVHENNHYLDCHSWVFTPQSFISLLDRLIRLNLFDYKVIAFTDTPFHHREFFVTLQKMPEMADLQAKQAIQLASLPTVVSPANSESL